MIAGHIIVTTCLQRGLTRLNCRLAYAPFLFGALLPDIIDKTLAQWNLCPGRAFGHSLVAWTAVCLLLSAINPKSKKIYHSLFAGTVIHLIEDIPLDLEYLLWPFYGPFTTTETFKAHSIMWRYYVEIAQPIPWLIEIVCLPWFLIIVFKYLKQLYQPPSMVFVPERVKR